MTRFSVLLLLLLTFSLNALTVRADRVEPLLDGWVRHQKAPFNRECPNYINDAGVDTGKRCIVGCVATALESILSYHGREIVLQDVLPAWSTDNFTTVDIPAGTSVDTRLILPDYGDGTAASVGMSEEDYEIAVDAVARLSLMCGMMAQMHWGVSSSGADAGNLVEPLRNLVGWKTVEYIDSYKYTPEQWREILKEELRHGRPILYTGYTMNIGGHAFVIDGFDDNDHFHINWGYAGNYDGNYYDITQLATFSNPKDRQPNDVLQGFFCNQQALILSPDDIDMTLIADSIKRSGEEIVIEDITIDAPVLTNKYTPVTLTLRNTADIPLCSPFEIFTNGADDEDIFKDGDYGALFGVNLQPGERQTLTIACKFEEEGERILRVSPDDELIFGNLPITVGIGTEEDLRFGAVEVQFERDADHPESGVMATFSVPVRNPMAERSGSMVTYCMMEYAGQSDGDWRHYDYYYLPAGGSEIRTVTFRDLTPGDQFIFGVRCPWQLQTEYPLTIPDIADGIKSAYIFDPADADTGWYDLSGRRTRPTSGLLIHNGKKILK